MAEHNWKSAAMVDELRPIDRRYASLRTHVFCRQQRLQTQRQPSLSRRSCHRGGRLGHRRQRRRILDHEELLGLQLGWQWILQTRMGLQWRLILHGIENERQLLIPKRCQSKWTTTVSDSCRWRQCWQLCAIKWVRRLQTVQQQLCSPGWRYLPTWWRNWKRWRCARGWSRQWTKLWRHLLGNMHRTRHQRFQMPKWWSNHLLTSRRLIMPSIRRFVQPIWIWIKLRTVPASSNWTLRIAKLWHLWNMRSRFCCKFWL